MRERLQAAQQLGAPELPPGPRPSVSASNMRDLYAHYEQQPLRTAFRTTTDADVSAAAAATACDFRSSPDYASSSSPATAFAAHRGGFLSPLSHSTTTKPPHSARSNGPSSVLSGPDTPITSIMTTPSSLVSFPPADCAASVSSRHTRTSKASKRTDMSLTDLDLQQTSVLSLSSDSEDDFPDVPKPSSRGVGGAAAAAAAAAAAVPRRPTWLSRRRRRRQRRHPWTSPATEAARVVFPQRWSVS
ncbi:hypothetical protein VTK73DRAFT_6424 [Phialemonium thermophilum]|uniref:Uncharacterized protein n=1 Tax=Phialemonium thermophilum TaxID=223376 RepID=A0ABR3UZI4_9PEZI